MVAAFVAWGAFVVMLTATSARQRVERSGQGGRACGDGVGVRVDPALEPANLNGVCHAVHSTTDVTDVSTVRAVSGMRTILILILAGF